ncbi:MAG TPA: HAD family hydrolase [Candidatus Saccharimonadia bacterium]|nr:HAD family hydrolase [Candidatus Saccharimonadia bacterium]
MNSKPRALLLDADGVVVLPPNPFSRVYAKSIGKDPEAFEPFFKGPFREALTGRADLADLVNDCSDLWQWNGPFNELIANWCEAENVPNRPLLEVVADLRKSGVPVFLATNQEQHRCDYLRQEMFKGVFDDIIASCEVGFMKSEPGYWVAAIKRVQLLRPAIVAAQVAYLDDKPHDVGVAGDAGLPAFVYKSTSQIKSLFT